MRAAIISSFRNSEGKIVITVDPSTPESALTDCQFERLGDVVAEYLGEIGIEELVGANAVSSRAGARACDDRLEDCRAARRDAQDAEGNRLKLAAGWW